MRSALSNCDHRKSLPNVDLHLSGSVRVGAHGMIPSDRDKKPSSIMVVVRHFRNGQRVFFGATNFVDESAITRTKQEATSAKLVPFPVVWALTIKSDHRPRGYRGAE